MVSENLPKEFLARLKAVTAKRAGIVIAHILKHGHITTEELKEKYGYGHPPRAAKDVRDQGIPLETFRVKGTDGRTIAAYRFGDPSAVRRGFLGGRRAFSKGFKAALFAESADRCQVCLQKYEERYLQIDHRVPYEVAGDVKFDERDAASYILVCASCNRAKSWSCEHCPNWTKLKIVKTCQSCYWASPESYTHIAMQEARRLDLSWVGDETKTYDELRSRAESAREAMPKYVKRILRQAVGKSKSTLVITRER